MAVLAEAGSRRVLSFNTNRIIAGFMFSDSFGVQFDVDTSSCGSFRFFGILVSEKIHVKKHMG